MKLPSSFYEKDVLEVGPSLLGCTLFSKIGGVLTSGIIIETESYKGAVDKACHAYNNRRTKRTETMFQKGGVAYVYLCYGIHNLLNVVVNEQEIPEAVLIRALKPIHGIDAMRKRRKGAKDKLLTNGPGTLTQALGITRKEDGVSFREDLLWIEKDFHSPKTFTSGPRIGIDYAEEDAALPYRFILTSC